jgi:hypothetical protein
MLVSLSQLFSDKGSRILSTVMKQSALYVEGEKVILEVPAGYKNEWLDAEVFTIKDFLHARITDREFVLEFRESARVYTPDVPFTFEQKVEVLSQQNPDIVKWFEDLGLKPL